MINGYIFDIKRFSVNDGPGIRTTIFLKGCSMKCIWCHNPESQNKLPEEMESTHSTLTITPKIIGEERSVSSIIAEIEKDRIFYEESQGGVTFSGGEPYEQPEFLSKLLNECRKKDIHTAVDTAGYISPHQFNALLDKPHLFLFDLKIIDESEHLQYTGISNRNILKNLETLSQKQKNVIIRFPIIPTITDTPQNIEALGKTLSAYPNIRRIDIIPYHRTGEAKYQRLNRLIPLSTRPLVQNIIPSSPEHLETIRDTLQFLLKEATVNIVR